MLSSLFNRGCLIIWCCTIFEILFGLGLFNVEPKDQAVCKCSDAPTKPCDVNCEGSRIPGQTIQNRNLLRLVIVVIGKKKKQDPEEGVWQLMMHIKENVSLPQMTLLFKNIWNQEKVCLLSLLKPKHHFMRHYPSLILKFGPLIRVWTLHFKSKHSYIKRCDRHHKNFKSICLILSEQHHMFRHIFQHLKKTMTPWNLENFSWLWLKMTQLCIL